MKILMTIGHPAHVHFFKNFVWEMEKRGHTIKIVAAKKDVTTNLLDSYGFKYDLIPIKNNKVFGRFKDQLEYEYGAYKVAKEFKPDIVTGIGGTVAAHISKIIGSKSIIFTDTEHANVGNKVTFPFADVICTPSCYKDDIGNKQIRYDGYHELAHLHPKYFTPDPAVLDEIGLKKEDNIFLMRFAAFDAAHDVRTEKFKKEYIVPLITKLESRGRIIISSERKLDDYLTKYQYNLPPEKYHDILYYSTMYIGEGSTSAEEAAVLGVPSLHFERLNINGNVCGLAPFIGILDELQNKYGLLYSYYDEIELLSKIDDILSDIDKTKKQWAEKKARMLRDKIDVTAFMVWFMENYPESFDQLKTNPQIQHNFQLIQGEVHDNV